MMDISSDATTWDKQVYRLTYQICGSKNAVNSVKFFKIQFLLVSDCLDIDMIKFAWSALLIGGLVFLGTFSIGGESVRFIHILLQLIIAVIGIGCFYVVWTAKDYIDNDFWIIVGFSLLAVSVLELLHVIRYVDSNAKDPYSGDYWIYARFIQGISFFIASIQFGKNRLTKSEVVINLLLAGYLILVLVITFFIHTYEEANVLPSILFYKRLVLTALTVLLFVSILYFNSCSISTINHQLRSLMNKSVLAALVGVLIFFIPSDFDGYKYVPSQIFLITSIFFAYRSIQAIDVKTPNDRLFNELKISEQRFRDLTLSMADWIFETDKDFRISYCSERITDVLGFTSSEMIGLSPAAYAAPKSKEALSRWIEDLRINPRSFRDVEFWYLGKDTLLVCFSTSGVPIFDDDGVVKGFRCVNQDVTSRKRAEVALSESEAKLRQFLESISDAVYLTKLGADGEYEHQYISHHYETLSGYPVKCFVEDWLFWPNQVIHEADRGLAWDQFLRLSAGNDSECEYRLLRANGEVLWVRDSARVHYQDDGSLIISGVISDITVRKKMEQALQESEANLSSMIETIDGSIWAIDRDFNLIVGNEDFLNTAAIVFGHRIHVGDNLLDQDGLTEKFKLAWLRYFERVLDGESFSKQLDIEFLPNSPIIEFRFNPIRDQDGAIWGVSIFGQDITARCQAENKIQAALAEKEVLLRELHHRVKNNLSSLMALIEMQAGELVDEQSAKTLYELHGRLHTMALVHQNLYQSEDLSRIEMRPYLELLTYNILYGWANETPVSLKVNADEIEFPVDIAIPCGLIVNELCTNALKYAFPVEHRQPNIKVPILNIGLHRNEDEYILFISDNGIGLPDSFDWGGTTSLGLKLVKLLATRQLGGIVDINTDHGTAFHVKFQVN